ncbi:hypothetical protein JL101_001245 [Skermanella rosea]|uniref:hypothetical protein n=1 Tax=Skermanella rosea TaxID=1817965 RepID=UPI001932137D|nr:hypothetical protein [Skermanella rosea]UEM04097.1 hypothetical protein JL101_001245 [Skermanella rosea]
MTSRRPLSPPEAADWPDEEFPRFKRPVGAAAQPCGPAEPAPARRPPPAPPRRGGRFALGFLAGFLLAGIGLGFATYVLIVDVLGPARPAAPTAVVIEPEVLGAPLPLGGEEEALTPRPEPPPAPPAAEPPPPGPAGPTPLSGARLFVHHYVVPPLATVAADVVGALRSDGLTVIDTRTVQASISAGNVRYFFPEDRDAAASLAERLSGLYRERFGGQDFRVIDFTHYDPKPRQRTIEIWLPG